ncbi:DUF4190 domain-containing protein [Micromonospora sp. NBC_00389]|uniref:DUF4190 domain-containing protein n=1 Tax=Micromonospora sp. NBC_00389 TaxID=2903586 RepID=UPI002E24F9AF
MTNPPPPGGWTDPTWSGPQSSPPVDPTLVAGQPVPTQAGPADPYAPVDPYAGGQLPPGQPMPGYAQPGYAQPGYTQPGYAPPGYPPQYPGYGYPPPPKTNGMALAAFVLALLGFTSCITAPVGAILGHVARKQIQASGEGGEGMAKAAIIIGWILTGLLVVVIAFYIAAIVFAVTTSAGSDSSY